MLQKHMARGIVFTLLGAIAWGFSGTCIQYLFAASSIDALLLTTIRQLGAGAVFLVMLLLRDRARLRSLMSDRITVIRLLVFGACGLFLNSALYALTVLHTNAGTATVLQSLNIVLALGVTCVMMRRLPQRLEALALVCALFATFFIATHADPGTLKLPVMGLVYGLATAATATFYTMYPKRLFTQWGSWAVTGMGMLAGGLTGLVTCVISGTLARGLPELNVASVLVLACAVLVGTCISYGLYLHGISIIGPVAGNMLGAAEPVSATVLSALWLGTTFAWADWAGLVLMVATILLIALQSRTSH